MLVTLESLRTDHVAHLGGPRETTPHLDALAAEAMVYPDAHSVTSWTLASHASLFTGLYPSAHRATGPKSRLPEAAVTLAELLAERGYQTAGFASGPYLTRPYRLQQGFEHYDDSPAHFDNATAHGDVTSPAMTARLERFLREERDPGRPLFLFAYYWDPHYDYIPPPPYDAMFVDEGDVPVDVTDYEITDRVHPGLPAEQLRWVLAQYDGELRWTDEHLGRLLEQLRELGLFENALVAVTSDHGEEFFDHGEKGHKHSLYAETVRVPLVVKYPGGEPRGWDDRLVSLVDLFPTILETAGVEPPPSQGRSLRAPPDPDRAVYFELDSVFYFPVPGRRGLRRVSEEWLAVRRGDWKLVRVPDQGRTELFDVRADPGEARDQADAEPGRAAELEARLRHWRERTLALGAERGGEQADLDAADLERLRALGYLH